MARHEGGDGKGRATKGAGSGRARRVPRQESVRDIMTEEPQSVTPGASVLEAARVMRDNDIGDVVVVDHERLYGIVTDRDIVVRVLAQEGDPNAMRVGEICSRELTTIAPDASVGEAVRLIREKSVRRLPVVEEGGQVVGIVSLGDIAVARDRKSALGDISAAMPNT